MLKVKILEDITTKDFIDFLSQLPEDMKIKISDPDTGDLINKINTWTYNNCLYLTGEYGEMQERDEEFD